LGQWDKGQADLEAAMESGTANYHTHYRHALLCLVLNESGNYRDACATMLDKFAETDDPMSANFTAWTAALAPGGVDDYAPHIALAEKAVAAKPDDHQCLNTVGAILYRAGRYQEAVDRLAELDGRLDDPVTGAQSSPAYTWYFLAMGHHALDHPEKAKEYLAKASAATEQELADTEHPPAWNRKLTLELLRKEAEALIAQEEPGGQPAPETEKVVPTETLKENAKLTPEVDKTNPAP
jgi:tetratricopeptide (TPR) repeat protein